MKNVASKSYLRRFVALFTHNFGLKLLSIALATLLYGLLKPDPSAPEQPPRTVLETVAGTIDRHEPPPTVTVTNTVTVVVTNTVPATAPSSRTTSSTRKK